MKGRDKLQRQQLDMMEETHHTLARKNASCQQVRVRRAFESRSRL